MSSTVNVSVGGTPVVKSVKIYDASGKLPVTTEGNFTNRYSFTVGAFASGYYHVVAETSTSKIIEEFCERIKAFNGLCLHSANSLV